MVKDVVKHQIANNPSTFATNNLNFLQFYIGALLIFPRRWFIIIVASDVNWNKIVPGIDSQLYALCIDRGRNCVFRVKD